jgi:hypothetical protein
MALAPLCAHIPRLEAAETLGVIFGRALEAAGGALEPAEWSLEARQG